MYSHVFTPGPVACVRKCEYSREGSLTTVLAAGRQLAKAPASGAACGSTAHWPNLMFDILLSIMRMNHARRERNTHAVNTG